MLKVFEEFSNDSNIDESILTIEDNMVKVWHYSNKKIEDGVISINTSANQYSRREYKTWGKDRSFFYCTESGYIHDNIGRGHEYFYVGYIPLNEIYDMNNNPENYEHEPGEVFENGLLEFTRDLGYTAWIYNLSGNPKAPIIISFVDVEISEAYRKTGRGYIDMDENTEDYKIGEITYRERGARKAKTWDVMQPGEKLVALGNTYLKRGKDVKTHFGGETYLHGGIKFLPEYENDY